MKKSIRVVSGIAGGNASGRPHAATGSHASRVAEMFGVCVEQTRIGVAVQHCVPVVPGRVTLITGDSGAGKSTLLRGVSAELLERGWDVVDVAKVEVPERMCVVDAFEDHPLEKALAFLSRAGLAEAGALLRLPSALSEGQAFRFRLALALAKASCARGNVAIVADEFAATLDRVTARVVAFGLRKQVAGTRVAAVVATSHEDVAEDLGGVVVRV